MGELKPCPFCGSPHPQWVGSSDGNYVECGSCLATMLPHDEDVPNETARWNTRTPEPAPQDNAEIVERVAEKTLSDVITEAKRVQRLVQGCLECNADDERRWRETIEWLEGLA